MGLYKSVYLFYINSFYKNKILKYMCFIIKKKNENEIRQFL